MSTVPRAPSGLGAAGQALWRRVASDVADGWRLDARDLATLESATRAADRVAELEALIARDGLMIPGSKGQPVLHPGVLEVRLHRQLVAVLLAKVELEQPAARTGRMSARQRNQLRDRRASAAAAGRGVRADG